LAFSAQREKFPAQREKFNSQYYHLCWHSQLGAYALEEIWKEILLLLLLPFE
jgi:hypothetical protein